MFKIGIADGIVPVIPVDDIEKTVIEDKLNKQVGMLPRNGFLSVNELILDHLGKKRFWHLVAALIPVNTI